MNDKDRLLEFARSDAQLVWARFSAILVAQAVLLALLGVLLQSDTGPDRTSVTLAVAVGGILLTWLWWVLTSTGWSLSWWWLAKADVVPPPTPDGAFASWRGEPLLRRLGLFNPRSDPIWITSHLIIWLFLLGYGVLIGWHTSDLFQDWPAGLHVASGLLAIILPLFQLIFPFLLETVL